MEGATMKKFIFFCIILISCAAYGQYPRDQKIITGEYFIDTDPGEGKGIAINTGNQPLWEVTVNIPNIGLPVGSTLYVRFKSTNGTWSAPRGILRKPYFENRGGILQYGEYFVNSDPGQGLAEEVIIQNGAMNIYSQQLNIQRGDKIYVRVKDNLNRWSPARPVTFNFKHIDRAEYYIKNQSGGTSVTQLMALSPFNPYTCVYTGTVNDVMAGHLDTACVRYQTFDKFYSKWFEKTIHLDPGAIYEADRNAFNLSAFPNPFSSGTTLSFTIQERAFVVIELIGITGNTIHPILAEEMHPGKYEIDINSFPYAEGLYLCKLTDKKSHSSIRLCKVH